MSAPDDATFGDDDRPTTIVPILCGIVLAAAVLAGIFAAWPSPHGKTTTRVVQPDPGPGQAPAGADDTDRLHHGVALDRWGCPPRRTGAAIPPFPPHVRWSLVNGGATPQSTTDGPLVVEGGVARCFSHTPAGALIAAVSIQVRGAMAPDRLRVARTQTVPGQGQDALIAVVEQTGPASPADHPCQVAGYRFTSYAPERSVISIASRCGDSYMLSQATVRWLDGDWKIELLPSGKTSPTQSALADLAGLTPWAGA